jgi:sugar/nucleoside kinase (ribokinase family)
MKIGTEKLKDIYARTEIFFCNLEEAERILQVEDKNVLNLSKGIAALGPKIVVISDGPNGAYMYLNGELWKMPIYPDIAPPFERTGAGDAFSSTITAALALGKTPLEAFAWGPINSMSVVQEIGAQKGLLSREKLEEYLKNAPENYKPKKVN